MPSGPKILRWATKTTWRPAAYILQLDMALHQALGLGQCAGCLEAVVFPMLRFFQLLLDLFSLFPADINMWINICIDIYC